MVKLADCNCTVLCHSKNLQIRFGRGNSATQCLQTVPWPGILLVCKALIPCHRYFPTHYSIRPWRIPYICKSVINRPSVSLLDMIPPPRLSIQCMRKLPVEIRAGIISCRRNDLITRLLNHVNPLKRNCHGKNIKVKIHAKPTCDTYRTMKSIPLNMSAHYIRWLHQCEFRSIFRTAARGTKIRNFSRNIRKLQYTIAVVSYEQTVVVFKSDNIP